LNAPYPPPAATPAGNDKTTLWGVLGIIFSFLYYCWPFGVIFAILSLMEARKAGKQPTLAFVAFGILAVVLVVDIILFATGNMSGLKK
jgi:hypothetical protein